MSKPEIIFIGTGSGKASLKRYFSSFIVSYQNYNLLIDAGDGISRGLLSQNIKFSDINGILLTHLHPDHYSGLASLIVQMKLVRRNNPLHIFINKHLKRVIEDYLYYSYLFKQKMGFEIIIETFNHDEFFSIIDNLSFTAKQNSHLNKYKEYADERELNFISSSILIRINDKKVFYSGDIGGKEDLYLFRDQTLDIMISEITHIDFDDLLEAYKILNPHKLYLTHISDEDEKLLFDITKMNENIIPATDGCKIVFSI